MTRPTRMEVNCETGVSSVIELTDEEIAERETAREEQEAADAVRQAEETRIAGVKASARAKLVAGTPLTEAEAATLVI